MDVLLIEDDKLMLTLLQACISRCGHNTCVAESGEEAINCITGRSFDLIISDIMMPGISGLSLVSILRSVHLCNTPIIIMSSLHNKPLLAAAFEAGANDFIGKPFAMKELEDKIYKYGQARA